MCLLCNEMNTKVCCKFTQLSQERVKLRTSSVAGTFLASIRTKLITNLGKKGA